MAEQPRSGETERKEPAPKSDAGSRKSRRRSFSFDSDDGSRSGSPPPAKPTYKNILGVKLPALTLASHDLSYISSSPFSSMMSGLGKIETAKTEAKDLAMDSTKIFTCTPDQRKHVFPYLALTLLKLKNAEKAMQVLASGALLACGSSENPWDKKGIDSVIKADTFLEQEVKEDAITKKKMTRYAIKFSDKDAGTLVPIAPGYPSIDSSIYTQYFDVDPVEWSMLFGIWFTTCVKNPSKENLAAFNEKRVNQVQSFMVGTPSIFVSGSPFLTLDVLRIPATTFNSLMSHRTPLIRRLLDLTLTDGASCLEAFTSIFRLTLNSGLTIFTMLSLVVSIWPDFHRAFPTLNHQFFIIQTGAKKLGAHPIVKERPFMKAIYGRKYSPVDLKEVEQAWGVLKIVCGAIRPSFQNLGGPDASPGQQAVAMKIAEFITGTSTAEGKLFE